MGKPKLNCVVDFNMARKYVGTTLRFGEGIAGQTGADPGEPMLIQGLRAWEPKAEIFKDEPGCTIISVPLTWREQVIGVLQVTDLSDRVYTSLEQELVMLFANQAAIAIQNSRLFEDVTRRATELELSTMRVSRSVNLKIWTRWRQVFHHLEQMMNYERGAIALIDEASGELRLLAHERMRLDDFAYQQELKRVHGFLNLPAGITRWVAEHGESIRTGDARNDSRYVEADTQIRSEMAVPLRIGARVIGAINVESQADAFYRTRRASVDNGRQSSRRCDSERALAESERVAHAQLQVVSRKLVDRKKRNAAQLLSNCMIVLDRI